MLAKDLDDVEIDYFLQLREELDSQILQYQENIRKQENQSNKTLGGNAKAKNMLMNK